MRKVGSIFKDSLRDNERKNLRIKNNPEFMKSVEGMKGLVSYDSGLSIDEETDNICSNSSVSTNRMSLHAPGRNNKNVSNTKSQ